MDIKKAALWKKQTKKGDVYLSVSIELTDGQKLNVGLFKNNYKKEDKHPDYVSIDKKPEKPEAKPPDDLFPPDSDLSNENLPF